MVDDDDDERAYRAVLNLAIQEARERSRKENQLKKRIGKSRRFVREHRERLIEDAMALRPDMSKADLTTWVDLVLGIEPKH